jgi:hypothetical protein
VLLIVRLGEEDRREIECIMSPRPQMAREKEEEASEEIDKILFDVASPPGMF